MAEAQQYSSAAESASSHPGGPDPTPGLGTITKLRKSFGFIKPVGSSLELFFHANHLKPGLEPSQLQIGLDVAYVQGVDPETGRPCATQVSLAPAGAAKHETIEEADKLGHIILWPAQTGIPRAEPGVIRYIDANQKPTHLTFTLSDTMGGSADDIGTGGSTAVQGPGAHAGQHTTKAAAADLASGLEWVLFKLCHKQQSQTGAQVSTALGAKAGYRAVQVRRVHSTAELEMEHLLHMPVLEKLALILPR